MKTTIKAALMIFTIAVAAIVIGIIAFSSAEAFAVTGSCGRPCTGGGGSQAGSHISTQGATHMSTKGAEHSGICGVCE